MLAKINLSMVESVAGEMAEEKKREKYAFLADTFHFVPLGFETLGAWGSEASLPLSSLSFPQKHLQTGLVSTSTMTFRGSRIQPTLTPKL